jgi:hypothetical protein
VSATTTVFDTPTFVVSNSASATNLAYIITNNTANASIPNGVVFTTLASSFVAPPALTLGSQSFSEKVYPSGVPTLQADGTYLLPLSAPVVNSYTNTASVSYYQPVASTAIGETQYDPSTGLLQKFDGTSWNDCVITDVAVTVGLQGAEGGGDKSSFALTDLSTGAVAPADTYINAQQPPTY